MKHIGKLKNTGAKVAVVFRTLPGESDTALVIHTAQLPDIYHDSLMNLIETDQAQDAFELGEYMFANYFPDGKVMLNALQATGRLTKVPTDNVLMQPTPTQDVLLTDLNTLIAEQKNCAVDELYTFVKGAPSLEQHRANKEAQEAAGKVDPVAETAPVEAPVTAQAPTDGVLSDEDLAKSLRSQADSLYKEAARMRREADELDPPKRKTATKKKVAESAE
jgi:hypothetical protein